jgi:hypothetical protein
MIERGIATLHRWLGEDSFLLQPVRPRDGDVASFEYALPADFAGVERTIRIGFPAGFPARPLRISVEPSPWLVWPHAMRDGLCLFGVRQRPASGTQEEVVDESMRRLGQLVALVMPDGDPVRRQRELDDEITAYWNQQIPATSAQLMLLKRPNATTPLLALSDTRPGRGARESLWLAQDKADLMRHWKRLTGETRPVREPAVAAFYLPLVSTPDARLPAAGDLHAWLDGRAQATDLAALRTWDEESAALTLRWLVLKLPGEGAPLHYAFVLRGAGMKRDGHKTYGRRAARRAPHETLGSTQLRALEWARIHVLDRSQVHSRDVELAKHDLAAARVVVVGAGSLGSAVATQLARAGVGHLALVDPELLEDANLGRHALGMDDLGYFKAQALRDRLRRDVPTVDVTAILDHVQFAYAKDPAVFQRADLIISTTADWPSELALWGLKAQGASWTFLQAWSEPYAHIGHAFDGRSLFDASGRFHHKMSQWPEDGIRALPGCGASYIPGGPVALTAIAATVAQAANRALTSAPALPMWYTIIDSPDAIAAADGSYLGPARPDGARQLVLERPWPPAPAVT